MNLMQMGLAMQAASIGKTLSDYETNSPRGHGVLKPRADDSVTGTPSPAAASDPDFHYDQIPCPSCKGFAYAERGGPCARCHATGYIEVKRQNVERKEP